MCLRVFSGPLTFPQTWLTFPGDLRIWSLLCLKSCLLASSKHWGENAAAEPAACPALRALLCSIWSNPSSRSRSVIRRKPTLYTACLFRDDWVYCLVFYLVLLFSPELWSVSAPLNWGRKAITNRYCMREESRNGVGGSERKRKQEKRERGRERSVSPASGWLVERTDTDWHLSSTETELKRVSLLFVHYSLYLSPTFPLLTLSVVLLSLSVHPAAPMSCFFCLDGLCSSPVLA